MKKFFLYLFSLLYGLGVAFRNGLFKIHLLKSREFSVPVISVGNITAGGTGKTPHTEYLIRLLSENFTVAVLSRGYKRKTRGFQIVETTSTVAQVGDEPLQIKRKFPDVLVAVDSNRVRGIEKILKGEKRPNVILLDDAFQHRYVMPAINILLTDFSRMITHDRLLPLGRLREPASARSRANIIIVTKSPADLKPIDERIITKELHIWPYQTLFFTRLEYGDIVPLFPESSLRPGMKLEEAGEIVLITGIARSEALRDYLSGFTPGVTHLEYPDHYAFGKKEIALLTKRYESIADENKIILTTEKDSVRIRDLQGLPDPVKQNIYYLPVEVKFLHNAENDFDQKIRKYVGKNKSNFELHSRKNRGAS